MSIGKLLFAAGIVVSVISGAKAPPEGATWPDTLPLFAFGVLLTIIGLVLWRQEEKKDVISEESTTDSALSRLETLTETLKSQSPDWKDLDCPTLNETITVFQEKYVRPFVETRQQIIDQFGMQKGSEIMIACSYGERMLNRVWSATADNHLPEAQSSLKEAVQAFEEVMSILENTSQTESGVVK